MSASKPRPARAARRAGLSGRDSLVLLLLAVPGIAWFLVFAYGPMVGLVVAFKAFNIRESGYTTTVLMALGYPDVAKQYTTPISRFDPDRLFTFA